MAESAVYLEVGVVFADLAPTVECLRHLVTQLSRTDALIWCARANLIVSNSFNTDETSQSYLLQAFLPENDERARALSWLRENASRGAIAFFRAQFLELAYWVAKFSRDLPDDGRSFENGRARRLFGQAALVAAGLWSDRVNRAIASAPLIAIEQLRRQVMADVRASLDENSRGALPYVAMGRGALLWSKYMPQQWPESDAAFAEGVGLSREDYFRSFAALIAQHVDVRPSALDGGPASGGLFMAGVWDRSTMWSQFRRLLDGLATPVEALVQLAISGDHDGFLREVRLRPIIRTSDERHIVLDSARLAAQAVVGPLFQIAAVTPKAYQCFVHFGNAFEAYVADLVANRYPNVQGLTARSCCREKLLRGNTIVAELDAAILTGYRQVCLIEAKAVFLAESKVHDLESYHAAIRQKYASGSHKPKGVAQLARAIREVAAGQLTYLPDLLRDVQTVFPVLLVYDHLLDAPGHAAFLADEFVSELRPDQSLADGRFRTGSLFVAAPIVVPIDDFEWLEASLAEFSLGEFLSEYSAADPKRVGDIRTFLLRSRFRRFMRHPEAAAVAAQSVLDDLGLTAFGEEWQRAQLATTSSSFTS